MFVLLVNDDGFWADGLQILYRRLLQEKNISAIAIVAPDRDSSGSSQSLTLKRPLTLQQHGELLYAVDGTPADCVHLALTGLLARLPDVIVSGINHGSNLGDDVLYSGTVGAAAEGRNHNIGCFAVSNISFTPQHLSSSAEIVCTLLRRWRENGAPAGVFNVNIPDKALADIRGIRVAPLGIRLSAGAWQESINPRGRHGYWIGSAGQPKASEIKTDFSLVAESYVAVTPLNFDLSDQAHLQAAGRCFGD